MRRTRVKICGITRPQDAAAAAAAGADAIGMVFYPPAERCVSVAEAQSIVAAVPAFVQTIGLFVNAAPADMITRALELGLSAIQLHGDETPETVAALRPLPVIKALRLTQENAAEELEQWRNAIAARGLTNLVGIILESSVPDQPIPGGTGVANDWAMLSTIVSNSHLQGLPPWIAAGGLTPETVGGVVSSLHPWAVDVSSGVEETKREKSPQKMEAFVDAVRKADGCG